MQRSHMIRQVSLDGETFVAKCASKFLVIWIGQVNFPEVAFGLLNGRVFPVALQAHGRAVVQIDQAEF